MKHLKYRTTVMQLTINDIDNTTKWCLETFGPGNSWGYSVNYLPRDITSVGYRNVYDTTFSFDRDEDLTQFLFTWA